ncbi:MAG: NUDIX domain-containing protein [Acidimicrobiia bacterium]|nr:NUDIX domain-containing protein [Acidimicrobiia bacterium]
MAPSAHFRAGVGVLIRNRDQLVAALERRDIAGSWQAPQGGIKGHELPLEAAARELEEETGLAWGEIALVAEHPFWLSYELPAAARSAKTGLGQTQRWFLVETGRDLDAAAVEAGGEFRAWRWVTMNQLVANVWRPRRPVYEQLQQAWRHLLR